ncbi:exodeoxyribonuclease VII [Neisseria gonorrhoeae]|nr:exodeoxyribonuclease VII [Neisseria gonorrhoeae]
MPEAKSENAGFGGKPVCPVSVFGVSGNFQVVIPEQTETTTET